MSTPFCYLNYTGKIGAAPGVCEGTDQPRALPWIRTYLGACVELQRPLALSAATVAGGAAKLEQGAVIETASSRWQREA